MRRPRSFNDHSGRSLTEGERTIARSVYGDALALDRIDIHRRTWWPFQPREVVMAPRGHIHFHPRSSAYRDDFSQEGPALRGLFVHELCHVWQHQRGLFLPLRRHPFCRYAYTLQPGWRLQDYGIEQQAEICRHAYLLREAGDPQRRAVYDALLADIDS